MRRIALVHWNVIFRVRHEERAHRVLCSAVEAAKSVLGVDLFARREVGRNTRTLGPLEAFVFCHRQEFAEGFLVELATSAQTLEGCNEDF